MEHHKCSNTIWSGRDQGFWWDGVKGGFITAVIFTSVLWFDGIMLVRIIKEHIKKEEMES